jgi:spore coat polysaccharide biosynthesis protein SpsF
MNRKLVAALACRNQGSRLYGKPLQNLCIEKRITVLDYIISWMKTIPEIDQVVLGIAEGNHNLAFVDYCKDKNIPFITGNEIDVLERLIKCGELEAATDIFRVTSESPFTYYEAIGPAWQDHVEGGFDFTCLDFVPDGSGFEIITLNALQQSHENGSIKHRSELCSLFIRENADGFRMNQIEPPADVKRTDIRLTIDFPEDLVLCRAVYAHFRERAPKIPLNEILQFLDSRPDLKALVDPFIDEGLKTMYL